MAGVVAGRGAGGTHIPCRLCAAAKTGQLSDRSDPPARTFDRAPPQVAQCLALLSADPRLDYALDAARPAKLGGLVPEPPPRRPRPRAGRGQNGFAVADSAVQRSS